MKSHQRPGIFSQGLGDEGFGGGEPAGSEGRVVCVGGEEDLLWGVGHEVEDRLGVSGVEESRPEGFLVELEEDSFVEEGFEEWDVVAESGVSFGVCQEELESVELCFEEESLGVCHLQVQGEFHQCGGGGVRGGG